MNVSILDLYDNTVLKGNVTQYAKPAVRPLSSPLRSLLTENWQVITFAEFQCLYP